MAAEHLRKLPAAVVTSVFPERDTGCCVRVYGDEHKFGEEDKAYNPCYGTDLSRVVSLQDFLKGRDDLVNAMLVVIVVAIGEPVTGEDTIVVRCKT